MKTYVYIDAFNLYFSCVRGAPYKWLDRSKLCGILLPRHRIEGIRYVMIAVSGEKQWQK